MNGETLEETEHLKYLGTIFTRTDMNVRESLKQRIEKSSNVAGAVTRVMKVGCDSYKTGRLLFTSQVRRLQMHGIKALPYSPYDLRKLDQTQTKFGRSVLRYYDCPPVAVLGEFGLPAMSEVAVVRKYVFLMRLEDFDNSRLVKQAVQLTQSILEGATPSLISIQCVSNITGGNISEGSWTIDRRIFKLKVYYEEL